MAVIKAPEPLRKKPDWTNSRWHFTDAFARAIAKSQARNPSVSRSWTAGKHPRLWPSVCGIWCGRWLRLPLGNEIHNRQQRALRGVFRKRADEIAGTRCERMCALVG